MNQSNLPTAYGFGATPALRSAAASASPPIVRAEPALSLLEILLRHKGKLLGCVLAAMLLGVVYQVSVDKVYESTAEVFIQPTRDGQPNSPLSSGGMSVGQPSTHARLLESVSVLLLALENPDVANSQTMADLDTQGARLRHLQKHLKVGFSKESEVVTISFRSTVPQDTATIVNAVVGAYLAKQKISVDSPASNRDSAAAAGPRGVMDERMLAASLMKLSEELTAAQVDQEAAAQRVKQGQAADGDLVRMAQLLTEAGMDSRSHGLGEIAYLRAELARLQQQLEGMPESWGPSHKIRGPILRQAYALQSQIDNLRQNTAASIVGLLANNRDHAAKRVEELDGRIADQQARATQMLQVPVDVFQSATVPEEKVAPTVVKTMGVAVFLGLTVGMMLVLRDEMKVAPQGTSELSHGPSPYQINDTTSQGATSVGEAAAMRMLMRADDMNEKVDGRVAPPMLGMVPEVPTASRLTSPNFDASASSIHQIRAVLQVQGRSEDIKAYAFTSPRRGAGKTSVAIGVASSLAMSGTRTLVVDCDLAGRISRGQTGTPAPAPAPAPGNSHADSHANPSTTNGHAQGQALDGKDRFGPLDPEGSSAQNASMDNIVIEQGIVSEDDGQALATNHTGKVGVTGMLDGGKLSDCIVQATVPDLTLLPAVNAHTRHIGKMSDAFIRRLIDEARPSYDMVLFDTGPIPGSVEALLVTSQVDGVIVVVPQGESRQALDRTMSYLKVVGATVTGTVFNRASHAPEPGKSSAANANLAGAAAAAADAGASRHAVDHAGDHGQDPLIELEKNQQAHDDDGDYLASDAPLGSGILAAAVFSDADSGYDNQDWKLEETSAFNGSVDDLFGNIDGKKNNGHDHDPDHDKA